MWWILMIWFSFNFFVVKSTNDKIYVHFKQRRFFVPFALILEFLVSCVTDGFESMALTPEGRWNGDLCWCRTSPETPEVFFHDPKKSEPSFFFQKTWKNIIWPCPSIDTGWQNRASNLGFCGGSGGWGVGPVVAMVAILKKAIKMTQHLANWFVSMKWKNIYFLLKPQKALGFLANPCKHMGCKSL